MNTEGFRPSDVPEPLHVQPPAEERPNTTNVNAQKKDLVPVKRELGRIPTTLADANETPDGEPAEIVPDEDEELDEDGNPIVQTEEATEEDEQRATPLDEEIVVAMPEADPEDTDPAPRLSAEIPVEDLEERVRVIPASTNDAQRDEGNSQDEGDAPEFMDRETNSAA